MTGRVGVDFSRCIQKQSFIGKTVYVDICENKRVEVEWGSGDWVLAGLGLVIAIALVAMFAALGRAMWRAT